MDEKGVQWPQDRIPVLAGFETVRWLGSGAHAEVWLVRPVDGGAPCAAKCFPGSGTDAGEIDGAGSGTSRHNETQITQEWRILAQYDHGHLLRTHDVVSLNGAWRGGWALLMDYAAGGSVQDMVAARGPLAVGECVTVLTPLGQVLSYLHGRGVVHGDVSPGNVLLTVHGKPVLGDLGSGRLTGQQHGRSSGTPGFFCVEDDGVSAASDVYAMAAVGWFALTGRAPSATRDRLPLAMYVPNVPDELAAALEAGLCEDASQRPTAAALAQAVFRSARAEPVALAHSVHPSVLPELLTRHIARRSASKFFWPVLRWRKLPDASHPGRPGRRGKGGRPGGRRVEGAAPGVRRRGGRWAAPLLAVSVSLILIGVGVLGWPLLNGSGGAPGSAAENAEPRTLPVGSSPVARPGKSTAASRSVAPPSSTGPGGAPAGKQGSTSVNTKAAVPLKTSASGAAALAALGLQAERVPSPVSDDLLSPTPEKALAALAWVRSYALSTADAKLLEAVNAAGSPAMAADAKLAMALAGAAHSYVGLETTISGAAVAKRQLVSVGSDAPYAAVTVSATVTTSAFAEQDAVGTVVYYHPSEQRQRLFIVLVQVRSRWVVQQILPAGR